MAFLLGGSNAGRRPVIASERREILKHRKKDDDVMKRHVRPWETDALDLASP